MVKLAKEIDKAVRMMKLESVLRAAAETVESLGSAKNFIRALVLGVSLSALGTSNAFALGRGSSASYVDAPAPIMQVVETGRGAVLVLDTVTGVTQASTRVLVAQGENAAAGVRAGNAAGLQQLRDQREASGLRADIARNDRSAHRDAVGQSVDDAQAGSAIAWYDASTEQAKTAKQDAQLRRGDNVVHRANQWAEEGIRFREKLGRDKKGVVIGVAAGVAGAVLGD